MPGPDKFSFDLSKLRGIYDTMRNKGYRESWEEFKGGMVGKDKYQVRKRIFDALKSNNDTSAKSYEDFVEGLRFVAPAKPKVAAASKLDLPKPASGGKPADGSEFFGKVMRGENVSGSEPIVPKRQDYGGFDKMMTADGRPLTGDATDTWERKLVRDHGKEAGLDDEQIRRIEDGLKVKNIVADMEQTKRDAAKIGRSEASSADLAADASYHDETSREADRRRRESGNYNTQVEFDRLKNNNPLIKTWKLSDHLSSVRNNDEEWLATGEKWYDENEGVFKSRVISNYGNEYVRSESVDEVIGRLKKESEELGRKVDERQLELYGGDKTKRTIADATATLTGQKLIFGMDPQLYHDDYGRSLAAAKRKIDERIETLEGHRDDPGFWAGVGERLSSRDWWTLGASDVADLSQDLVLKQKIDNGEELSDADVAYLRSSMYADRDGQFYGKRGFLNRAGKLTADAIPFVAEFVFTGGGMNALQGATKLGMKAATQVGKNALKRAAAREAKELAADVTKDMTKGAAKKALGTRAKMWLLKNTGVVADDLARAGVMANTVGAGRTAGDAIGRYVGSVGVDDEGKFVYEGGVSAGEALLKAEVGNTLEYYTEMLGNHLKIGDWVAKGTEKIGAGKLSKAIKWAGSNKWLEKGGIQDLPSEGLEEEANIVLNSMLVGDNKLSDLWDGETQADIWGGMALSVGFMRSVAAAHEGYVWSRYKMQERKVERADVVAGYRFGDMADWSALKERIDGTTNEDMKGVVMSIMNDDGLHAEQKKAALDYVGSLMQLRGYNLGSVNDANDKEAAAKEAKENGDAGFVGAGEAETEKVEGDMEGGEAPAGPDAPTSNSETAALPSIDDGEQGGPVGAAFNRGREADAQERQDIAIELNDPSNEEAHEAWNGVVQRINEDADLMVAQQRAQTKEMQHKDGNVRPAILKEKDSEGNDQQVYIVDGNVEMMPDGSMVDKAASDNIVVVYNPATGERKQIDPTADDGISSLGEVTTAEQREADIERSRQAYVQAQIDEAQGTVRVVPGQQLVLPTGEEGVVVAIDADGEDITVALGDGRQATVQRSELQRFRDEKALADYRQRHGITEEPAAQQAEGYEPAQPQAEGRVAGAPADYTTDMELTIRDEDGSEKPAMVMGRVRYENGSFVPDENGKIIEYYMDGEVKHAHEDVLSRDVVGYVAPHQTEAAPVEEASAETPATVETTPPPIEQQAEVVPQPMQTEEPMPAQPAIHNADESNLDITSRERVKDTDPMPVREDGEEDWQATTPERAHAYIFNEAGLSRSEGNEFIAAQIQAAQSALMKASSANMPKVGTSIRKYNEAKAKRQEKIDEAQRVLDYWNSVREIQNAIARDENERRAAEDAARHEEAVAQVQAEYEARKRAEAERKAVGHENPMPAITDKWNNATKVDGHRDEIMLPDGTALKGHYVLHESGASSPSHNPVTWQKTEGFPMDVNGGSVNDRDYERDLDAQEHTQRIAREYDQRALQNVPVVSHDGVVLSGNGRTMAGELAARDNTDGAYVNYLKEYAPKFGFTAEQVGAMQHPRVSFVPDEAMPYTAETFAKFNQQEMKSQNKTEMAVKLGKTVSDDSFKGIVRTINGYDTLGDFYNDADASLGAVYDLHNAGVVPQAQLAEMVDGVRGQEKLSAVGREFLENMLIGKAFEGTPDVVRMLTAEPLMRQTVITALGEIVDNIALGGGWSLQGELADAVKLCFDARQGGAKYGEIVSTYARQGVLFADPDELQTVADFNNATMLMLADVLNDKRVTLLKTTLQLYNNNARESASGQADMFAGGVRSREDILRDVINFINENYGKRKEIEAARAAAVERRKAEGVQQNGTPPAVGGESEDTGGSGGNEGSNVKGQNNIQTTETLTGEKKKLQERILGWLTDENIEWAEGKDLNEVIEHFGNTPEPIAVMPPIVRKNVPSLDGDYLYCGKAYMIDHHANHHPELDIDEYINIQTILDSYDDIKDLSDDGKLKIAFVKKLDKGFAVVAELSKENDKIVLHKTFFYRDVAGRRVPYKNKPSILKRWSVDGSTTISPAEVQQPADTENISALDQSISDGKESENPSTNQAKGEKVAENQSPSGVEVAVDAAERRVLEEEAKRTASHFPTETREEAAAFDRRVGEMSDLELLSFIKADGNGDVNKAFHPSVYDEFDYRYGDEISAAYDWYLDSLLENGTTLEQAEDMLANIRRDKGRLATDRRAELLGQEDALQDYIVELKNREDQQSGLPKEEVLDGKVAEKKSPSTVEGGLSATKHKVNTEPTEAQKQAVNYKNGHVKIDGFDVTIENPRGSVRRGTDASGKQWEQEMHNTYGYIRGTEGVDGDHIDVFLSDNPSQGDVFVVDQVNKDGTFDEHKVMYGFPDIESARKAYLSNYEDGWTGLGAITPVSKEEFKKWVKSSRRKTKPFAEYKGVKTLGDTQLGEQSTTGYSIEPTTYTNKKGKTTPMYLVTFGRELSKDEIRAGKELAKESRSWWDREKGGFMMRNEDSAKALAEALSNEEAVQDAQPLSLEDVRAVTDQADMKAASEAINVAQEPQTTPQYDYDREEDVYDKTLTGLRSVLNDRKRGAIPNIKSIEKVIRDLRKRAKTIENGIATAAGETIPQAFDALANLNGQRRAYEQLLVDIRKKMAETERDDALAAHGVKLGDKIMYKGEEATIHDANARQVTLDVGLAPVLYEVTDWENVEVPKLEPAPPQPKKVNVESLMGELNKKGEAKLSDHTEEQQQEESAEQPNQEEKKAKSKWVNDEDAERFEELRKRLRKKLRGQMNIGVDPEILAIGVEMSYLMLKKGARRFNEFAKNLIEALGDEVRPYIKAFYNGARDLPEMADIEKDMTPWDEVRSFDVMNFDKEGAKDIVATAEHIVREQAAEREAKEATDKLKQERNEQRKETEQEVAANTEAIASEAATVASEVESKLPSARSEREVNDLAKNIDDAIDKVNDQLALLGYYEAEPVKSDFNEAYGYMRNAEKKAVKNVTELFNTLTKELGISDPVVYDAKGKKQKSVTANIAPAGGDVNMRIMLNREKGVELYINFYLVPDYENNSDNLVLKGIMFRPERNLPNGGREYLSSNDYFPVDVTVPQMLHGIRSVCQEWLPAEDYVAMAQRIAAEKAGSQQEKPSKERKSKKKSASLQEQSMPDLFSGLFSEDELNSKNNDTARTDEAKGRSRQDGTVGSVSADRDRVLDTASTGRTYRGETARVSDEAVAVADGKRGKLPSRRSQGGITRVYNVASETGQPLSDGGRSVRDGAASDGRGDDNRAAAATSEGVPSTTGAGSTGGRREQLAERRVRATKQPEPKFTRNYLYPEDASEIDNMTPQQRLKANVEALEIVRTLMQEGRQATAEEREVLGRYRGWGGVELGRAYSTSMMRKSFTDRWGAPTEQGKLLTRLADVIDALDPNGERGVLSAINHAALTSYYTPTGVAKVMNRFAELAGFKGGNMLDPSMGNGIFEGTMSKAVQQRTMIHGVELDWLTGQIARNLYPDANVLVTGYQDAGTADNAYDVVMSNIPFGDFSVTDKAWKHDSSAVRKAAQNRIHNYFAVKMLDNTRPGGLCVIMTSNAILDTKGNQIIREHIADNAEVLGVVRLPDNTFKGAGTSVVTDVIFLRKYKDDTDRINKRSDEQYLNNIEKPFLTSGELQLLNPTDGKSYKVSVNGYFTKNKGMMIGDAKAGGQYRADQFGLGSNMNTDELAASMLKLVEKKIVGDRKGRLFDTHKTVREVKQAVSEAYNGDGSYISSGNIVEQDGMIGIVASIKNKYGDVNSTFTEMPELKGKANRVRAMLPIRKAMKQVIDWQIKGMKESDLAQARAELQKAYDDFTKKFGRLNTKENDFLTEDIDGYTLRSLEKWEDGKFVGLSDIFTKNTIKPALDLSTAKTPQEAISLSLAEYGEINPAFMEDVLGESWAEQCGETLFKEPFTTDSYLTADAYLSGDVKTKLEQAREAAKEDKALERNVKALEAVQPKDIPFDEISIRMGARWIPSEMYTDFMYDMFGIHKNDWKGNKSGVEYMPELDQYVVNVAPNELGGEADQWRTSRRSASEVFTAALQDKSLSVFDTIKEDGKETKILNKEETELLNGKIQDLRTAFEDWLSQEPEREEALMRLYNDKFNRTVLRKFDGSHLRIPGLMGMELRPHQKDAVWMLVNNRGGIVDHIVGAGKTLVMQSAIMEMRRMGIAKKPMIIGLKATCAQIAKEFREAYPAARILAPTERDFSEKNRKKFMSQIALNDYDCVILSHDQYCMLPHTEEVERGVIDEQMSQLDAAIEFLYGQSDKNQLTKKQIKGLEKRKANLEAKLASLLDRKIDREFTFEGLGVDYLFVDECQHFKSLPYVSTYDRVAGLGDKKGSQRAIALLNGVRYLQKMHQGDRGTVFLSGTTISNSLSEIYHLLNYLRPSEMEKLGMTTFDAWAGNYAIHTAELEYGVTNELKEKDRFRSLTNIPELSKMYAEIADVRNDMNLKLPKPKMRSHIVTVPQSDLMTEINAEIVNMVRNKDGHYFGIDSKDTTPWGLLASTLSAKAAINPRLIDDAYEDEGGKIPAVCEQVKKIYDKFKEHKGTQLIFCDTGVSSKGKKYDAYSDIINRLVNDYGIPRSEIADIHVADTDAKRKALFAKVNEGSVRILIGGTKNMGTGVNVQKRIVAMHHVDVPWTPADREQREGRGVRQGNEIARDFNDNNVDVYFYATEGSLDMYKYQLQETKGKLFAQFKSGTIGERTFDEGDAEGDFDPAEVVAMLSGNPVIFEKSKQDKKVEKLRRAKRAYESDWQRRRSRYEELQTKQRNFERLIRLNESDVRSLEREGFTPDEEGKYPATVTIGVRDEYSSRRTFDKPKEAGEYLHSLLKQGKKVELSGFGQKANVTVPITEAGLFGKPVAELAIYGGIKYTVDISDDDTAAGTAFRNLLQKVYTNKKVYERNFEDVKNQLRGADPGENKFPKQAELDEALKEKKRLDAEYKKLSDDKPKAAEDTAKYRTSEDLTEEYGDSWLTEQTNDDGRHTTQVKNTINSYKKFGEWVKKDSRGREVSVLDASSGLGLGTHWMRENGMSVDDVEPYPSADREEPTFGSYDEIDKQYDYIISNAVLNVIPDDWRASLLHDMASKLKPGGKLVINVRGAESIRRQGNEGMTRITLDDPSEILVLRPDGSIKAYQKGFTKDELQDWCEEELGDGYTVLKASRDNAGGTYDTAVVVIKNNESTTKGSASELGQPTENGAALANFGAMIGNNSERAKRLSDLYLEISRAGAFGSHQLLHGLNVALDLDVTPKEGGRMSTDHSRYYDLGNGVSLRIADHQGDANTFARFGHPGNNYGIVIKLSRSRFKDKDGVDYLEYVYYGDRIVGAGRQKEIVDGLRTFVESGDLSKLPRADKVNSSGRFKDAALPQQTERSSSAKRLVVEELAEKLHTDINIIEDVNEITHPNAAVQERRRKSKGWYDTATGQVNIVLDNNRDVDDVKASVGHETIAHKGLRELVGEENYDEFLDEVYGHLRDDLKQGVDAAAGRAFVDDATKNGKRAKSYEQHRRTAVDELFGRLAEKPFEEFTEGERTLWQKLKAAVRKLLDKFLGSLKLPKWFELGDNELRYILWRSKERLERGREHPIDLARDIVKREELGLKDEARYNMGDAPETFKSRQKRAVENKGTVMPGLNGAQVKVVDVPRHHYTGNIAEATRQAIEAAKTKFAPNGKARTLRYDNFGATFDYSISGSAVEESLNPKQQAKSVNKGVHIAMAEHLDEIIGQSIEVEEHPDYLKNEKGERDTSIINDKALMHRFYGAVVVDGVPYRVMTLMREEKNPIVGNGIHAYEVQKIEVLDETPNTPNGVGSHPQSEIGSSYPLAKLLQNVGKSYEKDKNLLDDSKLADESTDLYREGDDVSPDGATSPSPQQNSRTRGSAFGSDDIWTDGSMGLQERMTAAATRLANNHREDKTLRNDAMRAIGGNLADLRKAMSLQRTFDRTTVKRVADLARVLITNGYINNSTSGEIKRLMSVVKNSVGHNDIESDVQKVMDIMVDNQLKHAEETLHELEAIKGSKVDARGVEVQGQLDAEGAHVMKVFKKARGWEKTNIEEALSEAQQRMGSSDASVADEAALEYTGLQLAMEYAENIKDSKLEEQELRQELKSGYVDDSGNPIDNPQGKREWRASIEEAIRQNKIERVQAYYELVGRLTDSMRESLANAKEFKEAEKQRVREIQHNANSDMEGRPSDEHYKPTFADKFVNNSFVQLAFAPLGTFDQMLRMFGGKSANGEGYLYNRFVRGWVDARQQEINGVRDKYAILDAKASELFGGKVKTWGDLIRRVGKLPKGTVSFWNGGEMQEREMTQGNLMYIYMVNKMLDGRMKLRKMGISEEDVAEIERVLDPRLIELADWLQDEFLVQTRNEYNETHKRMFGASMAAIEHYFPLKILANARADKPEDLDNPDKNDGISTATGSIIKRRRNALALDITGADALSVILDHVAQMEHWNAFAEFNRDINTLRTYKRFRNQVENMNSIYGSGKKLWKKFNDVCQMASGTYRPPRAKLDEAAVNFAKGVTAAKVSFRIFTALKQFLSMPAYIPDARADYLLRNIANPAGAWKWSMAHLPIFNERWKSRMSGDPRLLKSDMDWKMWRTRIMQLASRAGMSPNAFVDALTVSIGAHSMYQTRKSQYLRDGYSEADAETRAVQDAEVLYNQTQQSSEGAFTSTMQVDRSWLSVLFTVFRNASMSYQRQLHDALRNLKHNFTPGGRARSIEFMTKQYIRDGIDEEQAEKNAKRKFGRQMRKDMLRVATFGYIMQLAWNLGAYLPYLLFGDDDDEKQKMWDDVLAHTTFGSVEGLTGGDLMSQGGQMLLTGEGNPAYLSKDMPLTSDIMAALKKLGNGQHSEALNDMINLVVQSGIGVNPQSITDGVLAIMDACGDDPALAHEATICISRILQVPQSQIDKMYFDELGLSGDEVSKYTPAQLAERYAEFKVKRGRFFAPWSWDDEGQIGKYIEKANKTINERTEQMGDKKVNEAYLKYEEVYKGVDAKVNEAKKKAKTDYVEAAQLMAEARSDSKAFETYQMFKPMDGYFNEIVKLYLGAKTPDEAALCRQAVLDYKSAMVKVLEAPDVSTRDEAIDSLRAVMQGFAKAQSRLRSAE